MVRQRSWLVIGGFLLVLATVSLPTAPAAALDDHQARVTLRGVKAVRVAVVVDALLEQGDSSLQAQLQSDVEERLQRAGISLAATALEWLHVTLHAHDTKPGYAFSVQVDLEQLVQVLRWPHVVSLSPTWGTGGIGVVPDLGPTSVEFVRTSVANSVDQFIQAYRRENPVP